MNNTIIPNIDEIRAITEERNRKDIKEYMPSDLKIQLLDGTIGYLIHPYGRFYIYD